MLIFNAKSERFLSLINAAIGLCIVLALVTYATNGIKRFKKASPSVSFSEFMAAEYVSKILPVLVVLAPVIMVLLICRSRARDDFPSLFATDRGLHFPYFPGWEAGRIIPWERLERVELGVLPHDPRISAIARGCTNLMFEKPLFLIVYLNCTRSQAWLGNRLLKAFYDLNDRSAVMPQEGAERMIIEIVQVTSCSQRTVARTINALINDSTLRNRFCDGPSRFVVVDRADDSTALLDASTGAEIDFGRGA